MKDFSRILILFLTAFLFVSCTEEMEEYVNPKPPTAYLKLLKAYSADLSIDMIQVTDVRVEIEFSDGSFANIRNNELEIHDCTMTNPWQSKIGDDGFWYLEGNRLPVKFIEDVADDEAYPFYVYFTSSRLVIMLSNGNRLVIKNNYTGPDVPDDPVEPEDPPVDPEDPEDPPVDPVDPDDPPVGPSIEDWEEETINKSVDELSKTTFPTCYVTTDGRRSITSKEVYIDGDVRFVDPDGRYTCIKENGGRMKIRGRGNTSWTQSKKPYKIKLVEKTRVFGMPANKDWCLIAAYSDKTTLRNALAMELSRRVNLPWSPRLRLCHLYINDSYYGVYSLMEHKETAKAKVNIDPAPNTGYTSSQVTGDFYIAIESTEDLESHEYWRSEKLMVPFQFEEPAFPSSEQLGYFKQFISDLEDDLLANNRGTSPTGYQTKIDMDSFIEYYIVQELSKNIDGNLRKSSFFVKYMDGPLQCYNVWDFDLAFGNANYFTSDYPPLDNGPTGWFVRNYGNRGKEMTWFFYMFKDPNFVSKLKAKWNEVYPSLKTVDAYIDDQYKLLGTAGDDNFKRWYRSGVTVWPNVRAYKNTKEEVDYMRSFYNDRLNWLNTEIGKL